MSKALCRVTSKVFLIYTSSTWRSTVAAAGRVLRGSSEWGGNGVWHVDSGVNPPGLLKRLLLEFNHPAILDTLWGWEGWLMSTQRTKRKHLLIQKLQSTRQMDECSPVMRKQNKLRVKQYCYTLLSTFHTLLKSSSRLRLNNCSVKPQDYTCKWALNVWLILPPSYILSPPISQGLRCRVPIFFFFQQAWPLVFIMHSLFLDKGHILLSVKTKERSTS